MKENLIILDRDGVINFDSDSYIKSPAEWKPIPGSLEAMARLYRADYQIVIATNQSGIARGLLTGDTLNRIHKKMCNNLHKYGGRVEAIFFCPHHPEDGCQCRKPKPGMFYEIKERLKTSLNGVPVVGDSLRDLESANNAGCLPVLVLTGKGQKTKDSLIQAQKQGRLLNTRIFDNLETFAQAIISDDISTDLKPNNTASN